MDSRDVAESTIDLAALAQVDRGDLVRVQRVRDRTDELFVQTLDLVEAKAGSRSAPAPAAATPPREQFLPENEDLRSIYLLAEAVGGYAMLQDLVSAHSPGRALSDGFERKARRVALAPDEVRILRDYRARIDKALANANAYLREIDLSTFGDEQLHELHRVMLAARDRARQLNEIMGLHLQHEVERAVATLYDVHCKSLQVERSVSGLFLVDSEVMFIPAEELVGCVNVIFDAIGNSWLADTIDGVLLLAARNLLIEVTSFYSYYGKQQIWSLYNKAGADVDIRIVSRRIRVEIRRLFQACQRDNKLVLTRVMRDAERRFELSVDVIERAAERQAIEVVERLIPQPAPPAPPPPRGWWRRLRRWFLGG